MIHFGFCYVGLIYLLMLFTPNIIWAKNKPADYDKYAANESKVLLLFERAGEVLLSIGALIFSDCNIRTDSIWCLWLLLSFLFMVFYELYWLRYFKSSKTMADQYSTFLIFPVAGASLPCLAFFALGIYGTNIFLIISSIIMTIGHVGIHLAHTACDGSAAIFQRLRDISLRTSFHDEYCCPVSKSHGSSLFIVHWFCAEKSWLKPELARPPDCTLKITSSRGMR